MPFAESFGGLLVARIPRSHLHAASGETVANREADAPYAAGYQRNLSGHVCHCGDSFHAETRKTRASPWPPPPHSPAAPMPPPRRPSSRIRCRAMRAPDAPAGWPMAMAPPLPLTLAGPTPRSRIDWMATTAKASLISNRSRSSGVRPSRPSALRMAFDGCDNNDGSGPATRPAQSWYDGQSSFHAVSETEPLGDVLGA